MKVMDVRYVVAGLAMLLAAGGAVAMKPTKRLAEGLPSIDLERTIPSTFNGWRTDPAVQPVSVAPDVQARLDKIYSQVLSRTYINESGQRVMLSIAYGGDQSNDSMQVHRPEYCYAAQGFSVLKGATDVVATTFGDVPIKRLLAKQGGRNEPITYWITIGEEATLPGWGRKVAQLKYGLTGQVPDGMLVRVSSIGANSTDEYALQDAFIKELIAAMDPGGRKRVIGADRH